MATMAIYMYYLGLQNEKKRPESIAVGSAKSENGDNFWIMVYIGIGIAQIS